VLDGVAGDLWFISIYLCICLRTRETVGFFADHGWMLWTLASLAGASHICQAAVARLFPADTPLPAARRRKQRTGIGVDTT